MVLWVPPVCRLLTAAMLWEQGGLIPRRGPKASSGVRGSTTAGPVAVTLRYTLAKLKSSVVDC